MIVNGNNISMTRGDSETITISCTNTDSQAIPFVEGDTVYLTMKKSVGNMEKILQKIITVFINGRAIIELNPEDTKNLEVRSYVYDIQLTRASGSVTTLVKPSKFIIEGEVTYE